MPSDKDIVVEARMLLDAVDYNQRQGYAKQLLRALANEVERLREQWNTRFNTLCGNCGRRYRGPRDENQHGIGVCHAKY